jgi:histidinol-phosphate aminotransferase
MSTEFNLEKIVRPNIWNLSPYTSARDEFKGQADVYLDANENSFGSPLQRLYNRYPDPFCGALKEKLSTIKGVPPENIFVGNGSDEAIDIMYRMVCEPGVDNAIICPPTYGMYKVSADINNIAVKEIPLLSNFQLDVDGIANAIDVHTKIIWVCSPNNPVGVSVQKEDVEILLNNFNGLVVIDEAYINYSRNKSFIQELTEYPNLVVCQTMSKAWGLAALRIGMAYASEAIIQLMNKTKAPYNVNEASQQLALQALENIQQVNDWIKETVQLREALIKEINSLPIVDFIYPTDANFLLVKYKPEIDATKLYYYLTDNGIVVRSRAKMTAIENSLRITVGTAKENDVLIKALENYKQA